MTRVLASAGNWFVQEACQPLDAFPRVELADLITQCAERTEAPSVDGRDRDHHQGGRDGHGLHHGGLHERRDHGGHEVHGGHRGGHDDAPPPTNEVGDGGDADAVPFSFEQEHWVEYGHVVTALRRGDYSLKAAPPELRADRYFVKAMVATDGCSLRFADASLQADRQVVLAAVANAEEALVSADEELRADVGFILAALDVNCKTFRYVGALQSDKMVALAAVAKDGSLLQFAAESLQEDRDVVLAAVVQCGDALRFAARTLRSDMSIVKAAVQQTGHALRYAGDELRRHPGIVQAAIGSTIEAAQFASSVVWQDMTLVMDVLPKLETDLEHKVAVRMPLSFWEDAKLVKFLVERKGGLLRYASAALVDDTEVVLIAVRQSGVALRHASERLRSDRRVVRVAFDQHPAAIHYALGDALQQRILTGGVPRRSSRERKMSGTLTALKRQDLSVTSL